MTLGRKLAWTAGLGSTGVLGAYYYFHLRRLTPSTAEAKAALEWAPPSRSHLLSQIKDADTTFDLLVIGGGASGAGCAVDAAHRGLRVACVEKGDFASGSSSKSTKLVHGGVRYLEKAVKEANWDQFKLVKEALAERSVMLKTMPHLTHALPIMIPIYKWWQVPYYWFGSKGYDAVAGAAGLQSSYYLGPQAALNAFPLLNPESLYGAMVYFDGQMNDARANLALALTAIHLGATMLNYVSVQSLMRGPNGRLNGAICRDELTGEEWPVKARGIINATGPHVDSIRKMDDQHAELLVIPSSGSHIVLPDFYAPHGDGKMGLIDPDTSDGRVIFFLPWQGNVLAGTTEAPASLDREPRASANEVSFILDEVRSYLNPKMQIRREDVLSAWSGIRPLIRDPHKNNGDTSALVRSHLIEVSQAGLITLAGGKWTTYRHMAEECIDKAVAEFKLNAKHPRCRTHQLMLIGGHGWDPAGHIRLIQLFGLDSSTAQHLSETYGDRAVQVAALCESTDKAWPVHGKRLLPQYPHLEAEIRHACRAEYALHAVDVIARRLNLSFLNSRAAQEAIPRVVAVMAEEHGWSNSRCRLEEHLAREHLVEAMGLDLVSTSRTPFSPVQMSRERSIFYKYAHNHRLSSMGILEMAKEESLLNVEALLKAAEPLGSIDFADFLKVQLQR